MKVRELIQILQTKNPEAEVVVDGYEKDFDIPNEVLDIYINRVSEKDKRLWAGGYTEEKDGTPAVYLPRNSW